MEEELYALNIYKKMFGIDLDENKWEIYVVGNTFNDNWTNSKAIVDGWAIMTKTKTILYCNTPL